MPHYTLEITEDEAIVLHEFFERFHETSRFELEHAAEYLALQRISAQINKTTAAMFDIRYGELLDAARGRVAEGFEGEVPGLSPEV